jgi:hypothetical protein
VIGPRQIIGFDQTIRLAWLDATAGAVARGLTASQIRSELEQDLMAEVPGEGPHNARGKAKTILLRIWVLVPESLQTLRDEAIQLLSETDHTERLAIHWGMCLAAYPLFRSVAATVGRLLEIQSVVAQSQVIRRTAEIWGDRTTIHRAVPRILGSFVDWGVLRRGERRGLYYPVAPLAVPSTDVQRWLVEALFASTEDRSARFDQLVGNPALFPFKLSLAPRDLFRHPRLELLRLGLDADVVARR